MRLTTRLVSVIVPVLAAAGLMVSGAVPAQAATGCGPGTTRTFPGGITLANTACADETVLSGGQSRYVGRGAYNVRVPLPGSIRVCTSYVFLFVNGTQVDNNVQSCTAQARAGVVSTNSLPPRVVEAGDRVQVQAYFAVNYRDTRYESYRDYYNAQ